MTNATNHTELSIGIAKRRIQALEQMILEQPSGFDVPYFKQRLEETNQVLAQMNASLEQPKSVVTPTVEGIKQQLERVFVRLRFAEQTLADPETDEHLQGFVKGEQERLLQIMDSLKAELRNLDSKAVWEPPLEHPEQVRLNQELNRSQEEARRIAQLRETLLAWVVRLPPEDKQRQTAQEHLEKLETNLESANSKVAQLKARVSER